MIDLDASLIENNKKNKELEIASQKLSSGFVAISTGNTIELLKEKDIVYLEADGKYTVFYMLVGKEKIVSKNIGEYEKSLPKELFFRIHHKYIINLRNVKKITRADGYYCTMNNGTSLSVAKRRQESLRKFLNL